MKKRCRKQEVDGQGEEMRKCVDEEGGIEYLKDIWKIFGDKYGNDDSMGRRNI